LDIDDEEDQYNEEQGEEADMDQMEEDELEEDEWEVVSSEGSNGSEGGDSPSENTKQISEEDFEPGEVRDFAVDPGTEEAAGQEEEQEDGGQEDEVKQQEDGEEEEPEDGGQEDEEKEQENGEEKFQDTNYVDMLETEVVVPQLIPITKRVEVTKILSDEEWQKLRKIQEKLTQSGQTKKRKLNEIDETVTEEALEPVHKRARATYEERVAAKLESKADLSHFKQFGRKRHAQSTSNVVKKKTKNFMMVRQKAFRKNTRSKKDTSTVKSKHLQKQKRQKLNKKF